MKYKVGETMKISVNVEFCFRWVWVLAMVLSILGCAEGSNDGAVCECDGDGETADAEVPDGDGETVDAEAPDGDGETADAETPDGVWFDPATGLTWESPSPPKTMNWGAAWNYCYERDIGGYDDWRLPTISELRSLVRNCPQLEIGGSCQVTDNCLGYPSCSETDSCLCPDAGGGCHWPEELEGSCEAGAYFWSSSIVLNFTETEKAWFIGFYRPDLGWNQKGGQANVRCVRQSRPGLE